MKATAITLRAVESRRVRKHREAISGIYRSPLRESLPIPGTVPTSRRDPRTRHNTPPSNCSPFSARTLSDVTLPIGAPY